MTPWPNESPSHFAARRAPVGSHRVRGDSTIIDGPARYQIVTPSDTSSALNEVLWLDLSENGDSLIDDVFSSYAALGIPFKWCVWPWSQPADLGDRLRARGTTSWHARGMSASSQRSTTQAWPARAVETPADREAYARVYAAGWGEPLESVQTDVASILERHDVRLFVAWDGPAPAGVASYRRLGGEAAYLMGSVVLPSHRGRGLYRALIEARLADLADQGVPIAVTHAREATSAPILERLGFATEFRYTVHRWGPPGSAAP